MLVRALGSAVFASMFYLLYYACQYLVLFVFPFSTVMITVIASVLFAVLAIFILKSFVKNPYEYIKLSRPRTADIPLLLVFGASLNIICSVAVAFIPFPETMVEQYAEASAELSEPHIAVTALLTLMVAPTVEELLFRGLIFRSLRSGFNVPIALILSAALFGIAHSSPIWIIYASFFGGVLAYVYEKYNSLTASVLFHFGFNLVGFIFGEIAVPVKIVLVLFPVSVIFSLFMFERMHKCKNGN